MVGRRSLILIVLAVPLLIGGLAASYVRLELAEPQPFSDRAVEALQSREVRSAIAEQVAVAVIERGSPDLVASRPLVLTGIKAILQTGEFERLLRHTATAVHGLLLRGDRDVAVELQEASDLVLPAVESVSPKVARQIPTDLSPRIAQIRGSDVSTWALRLAHAANDAALPLLLLAVTALGLGVATAPDRRRALTAAGVALAAAGGVGLTAMAALRAQVLSHAEQIGVLSSEDAQAAAGATWDAFAGGLEAWLFAVGIGGLLAVAGGLLVEARIDRGGALRHAAELAAGGGLPRPVRVLRGLVLAGLGALILLRAEPILAAAVIALGGTLVVLGLAELISIGGRGARIGDPEPRAPRWRLLIPAAVGVLATVGAAIALVSAGGAPDALEEREVRSCNGLAELCERRLDEVVLPGTHNSMSAADRPGWFFANQVRPIPRQLRDGIRLLMIDPHYGIVDSEGRVRTDLRAEGTNRNRVAAELGVNGIRVAERLAGRLGLVPSEGDREIFLCHSLCELGAERMSSTLGEVRGFLERNLSEVVVVFIESSVDPADVEREFEEADLEPHLITLSRGEPFPTLRSMISSGRRLVVFDQGDGGDASWYQSGFAFMQESDIRSLVDAPNECRLGRGTPESPMFLLNHWIDRFPPPISENADVSRRGNLLRRVRRCKELHGRRPNLIAVDFYDRGEVIAVARALNRGSG